MKPIILYVDDEAHNLTVFEAALPSDWEIHIFDNPLKALDFSAHNDIWVIVSDQRMPGMSGVNFLEILRKTHPHAKRVLVTGYSDEDLIIESVRKAQVHDYIRKPWDVDDLEHRMKKMVESYQLERQLRLKTEELEKQNSELLKLSEELRKSKNVEESLRVELESWAPPFVLKALQEGVEFPLTKDLAVITFDIIDSSKLHGAMVENKPVRSHILQMFSEAVIRHGGWRESTSGDSAYAHFGVLKVLEKPSESALAVASEFRVALRNFSNKHSVQIECGIGLHLAKQCVVDVHTIQLHTPSGMVTQKSFDSASSDIDLVHRIEHMIHILPGSNIVMSEEFVKSLEKTPIGLIELGYYKLKGQKNLVKIHLKPSDTASPELIKHLQMQAISFGKAS